MAKMRLLAWRRPLACPELYRTVKRTPNAVYVRLSVGRHAGAPVVGKYKGLSEADCDNQIADDEEGLRGRYKDVISGAQTLGTVAGLLAAWERSAEFEGKSASTKHERARILKSIVDSGMGAWRSADLKRQGATGVITKWRDKQALERGKRAADYRMEVLNAALSWHVRQGNIPRNPAAGIPDVSLSDRSDLIWEPAMVQAYRAHIKAEIARVWTEHRPGPRRYEMIAALANAYDALTVALNTGMRRADISLFAWIWVRDGAIVYTPSKSRNRARTAKKPARVVVLPILPEMARTLARRREVASGPIVIPNRDGQHYQPKGIGDLVAHAAAAAKIEDRHLHDAKGTFVTRLATQTDLTDQEIAKLVDWSVANVQSIIARYVSAKAVGAALLKRFGGK